jgi:hypothetical protein
MVEMDATRGPEGVDGALAGVVPGNDWRTVDVPDLGGWRPTLRVTVVLPCFQGQEALGLTFADLAAQTYPSDLLEVVVAVVSMLFAVSAGDIHEEYFEAPSRAGDLVAAVAPPEGQEVVWHVPGVPWPTWISYAWGLPPAAVATADVLAGVPDDDLVVVRFERLPTFLVGDVAGHATEAVGGYGVVTGADLRRHVIG